jgi:hypothetical protein
MTNLVTGLVIGITCTILAAVLTYYFAQKQYKKQRLRKIRYNATYCPQLLAPTVAYLDDNLKIVMDGNAIDEPAVIAFNIESVGHDVIRDVKMIITTHESDRIVRYDVHTDNRVKCERLRLEEGSATKLRFRYDYINPRDHIVLVMLVAPCTDPECVKLEIDAEGLEVEYGGMLEDCSVRVLA